MVKKSLQNQMITLEYYTRHDKDESWLRPLLLICFGAVIGMSLLAGLRRCETNPEPVAIKTNCTDCHNRQMSMANYFKARKSLHPDAMAEAVLSTRNPRLLAAIAVAGERNTPYTARRTGYKRRHSGAWQVSEKYWGKVPYTMKEQAKQADDILMELTDKKTITAALSNYGGDSTDAYQKRVIDEFTRVP